jgi:DnaK suppressor protein
MEKAKAQDLLHSERLRVEGLLADMQEVASDDRTAANQSGDMYDSAEPLTGEQDHNAVEAGLRDRLEAIERAQQRLDAGTYGVSIRSGEPIPDERLEADPAAELTVQEAQLSD